MTKTIAITAASRTAIGSFCGQFSSVAAHDLGAEVIKDVLGRSHLNAEDVSEVVMGHVLTTGQGQNTARQAALKAGIPEDKTAYVINQVCGSGLRAVALGAQSILSNDNEIVIAGGQENMSQSPHSLHLRNGKKFGDEPLVDTMLKDGLWCAFNDYHMGTTAENIAQKWQITRDLQDEFAAHSQQKAEAAQKNNYFDKEITPVTVKTRKAETSYNTDEYPRHGTTKDSLSKLRPAFAKEGTVTAGNASGLNDGAAAVVLMSQEKAEEKGLKPLAFIRSFATAGVDPSIMGTGPIPASRKALERAGWSINDLDLVEANEAFAAQAIAVKKELNIPDEKINVNGGAIALGHPIGASGARILVTLLHEMDRRDVSKGLATLCVGGGMGIALCVERP